MLFVCFSHDYDHNTLPNVMKFGTNVPGSKAELRVSKDSFIFFSFQNGGSSVALFLNYGGEQGLWNSFHLLRIIQTYHSSLCNGYVAMVYFKYKTDATLDI